MHNANAAEAQRDLKQLWSARQYNVREYATTIEPDALLYDSARGVGALYRITIQIAMKKGARRDQSVIPVVCLFPHSPFSAGW